MAADRRLIHAGLDIHLETLVEPVRRPFQVELQRMFSTMYPSVDQ